MPILKTNPPPAQLSSEAHSVESVREWRQAIEEFFNEDWPKLTHLILSIEESLWEDGNLRNDEDALKETDHCSVENQTDRSTNSELDNFQTRHESIPVATEPEQQRRLEELAKKIEMRLKKTDAQ